MQIARLVKHVAATHWRTRMLFPARTLDAIEQAIGRAERAHTGELRFVIETALTPLARGVRGIAARPRARGFRSLEGMGHRAQQRCAHLCTARGSQRGDRRGSGLCGAGQPERVGCGMPADGSSISAPDASRPGRSRGSMPSARCWHGIFRRRRAQAQDSHNQLPDRPTLL